MYLCVCVCTYIIYIYRTGNKAGKVVEIKCVISGFYDVSIHYIHNITYVNSFFLAIFSPPKFSKNVTVIYRNVCTVLRAILNFHSVGTVVLREQCHVLMYRLKYKYNIVKNYCCGHIIILYSSFLCTYNNLAYILPKTESTHLQVPIICRIQYNIASSATWLYLLLF